MEQLATVLRAWRDRLDPAAAGFTQAGQRRVPGLRRQELAELAGISSDYLVQLEQGRASTPSPQVCSALARALQLSDAEQEHLMRLAGHAPAPGRVPRLIPHSVHRILEQLSANPVAVYDAAWNQLHRNPLFEAVFGVVPGPQNTLLVQFGPGFPRTHQSPAVQARFEESIVADLRVTSGRYPHDPDLNDLIATLQLRPRFAELWQRRAVEDHQGSSKTARHPQVGDIALECSTLTTQGSDLRILVCTAQPGTDARSKLDLLMTIGTQTMTSS
ncbi:helix-turn-helix transcriptional regulator [Kineosporia succinea]|uniref:Transcriptional regulator with XRE-family HTH domain n=1 Tax=Kineosporia succinea TaxID=84632 RepID=A0ABT9PCF6_9ACTN|nr:helix-turn-helix transcriptional regulator [Kineosporia succinea]MDP9830389.1 transcriptional regulator with XRE-family HTH domain [Kineosporia succinea]